MGIIGLNAEWLNQIPGEYRVLLANLSHIDYLHFDLNSLLHEVFRQVYPEGSEYTEGSIENQFLDKVVYEIAERIDRLKPRKGVVIAVDGVAPLAKQQKQRQRRFKNPGASHALTAGTQLMEKIHQKILKFLRDLYKKLPPLVFYTSHRALGEGEHKIFNFMLQEGRTLIDLSHQSQDIHVIYGLDGDLVMLALQTSLPRMYLLREGGKGVGRNRAYLDITAFKYYLLETYNLLVDKPTAQDLDRQEAALYDTILMIYLCGNDFLPTLPGLPPIKEAFEIMAQSYRQLGQAISTHYTLDTEGKLYRQIDPTALLKWLEILATHAEIMMKSYAKRSFISHQPLDKAQQTQTLIEVNRGEGTLSAIKHQVQLDAAIFRREWLNLSLKFHGQTPEILEDAEMEDGSQIEIEEDFSPADVEEMAHKYLEGIFWTFFYYTGSIKVERSSYIYNYHFAPTLADLLQAARQAVKCNETFNPNNWLTSAPVTRLHQLLAVLPLDSHYLLPDELKPVISSLYELYPTDFITIQEGAHQDWQAVPLIPFINFDKIERLLHQHCPKFYQAEIKRKTKEDQVLISGSGLGFKN